MSADSDALRLFKKVIVSHYQGGRRVKAGTPGAEPVRAESSKWYGRIPGKREPVPLAVKKGRARAMLASSTMHASAKAKKANPRLNKVPFHERAMKQSGHR